MTKRMCLDIYDQQISELEDELDENDGYDTTLTTMRYIDQKLKPSLEGEELKALIQHTFDLVDVKYADSHIHISAREQTQKAISSFEQSNFMMERSLSQLFNTLPGFLEKLSDNFKQYCGQMEED